MRNVLVTDAGCVIRAKIDATGRITVEADGGCGPNCLGQRVPRNATSEEIERVLTDRFIRLASENMGEEYIAAENNLIVRVMS